MPIIFRYQKKCDELEVANAEFKKEYEQISSNTKEVVAFLKKSLRERGNFQCVIHCIADLTYSNDTT